jgi:hypothetical protein
VGNVTVSSDGIRVLDISTNLTGIIVRDGTNCSGICMCVYSANKTVSAIVDSSGVMIIQ